jgi:predicted transcriptional regulator of viral defense system
MHYDALIERLSGQPFFDLAMVVQLTRLKKAGLRTQLYRWVKQGKLLPLRRGMYAWPERYRRNPLNPAELANALHRPSYLSGLWALGFYGLVPEKVVTYTSITSRTPRRFENNAGVFEYRHIKPDAFFGYVTVEIQDRRVLLAEPEKALLDFWYLGKGAWTMDRMEEMRFQNCDVVNRKRLGQYARRFNSIRLREAARAWCALADEEKKGTVKL